MTNHNHTSHCVSIFVFILSHQITIGANCRILKNPVEKTIIAELDKHGADCTVTMITIV